MSRQSWFYDRQEAAGESHELESQGNSTTQHDTAPSRHKTGYVTVEECEQLLLEGHPTFVPTFNELRATCLKDSITRLQGMQAALAQSTPHDGMIDEAEKLLHKLDRQTRPIIDRHELENPAYAAQHGVSLTHFTVDAGEKQGNWMLLASDWSSSSASITEANPAKLNKLHRRWIEKFCEGSPPSILAFKRPKSLLERQPGAVRAVGENNVLVPKRNMVRLWFVLLSLALLALYLFLAVGIIATTTTFTPFFLRWFFWIAIMWTLCSSALLAVVVRAFGASPRDVMSAFLAGSAIMLVLVQIGQTHLSIQDPTGKGIYGD